jgi:head-tail adaptor
MQPLNPGPLRHQVSIYRPATGKTSRGQRTGDPTLLLADVPCSVETLSGLELIRGRKQLADATHQVRMWADPDTPITPRDYLVFGSRTLHIGHVHDVEQLGIVWELLCREEV